MARRLIFQDPKQVAKHGTDRASHYVGWIDPDGKQCCKSCGPGEEGLRNAEKLRKKREAELIEGTYKAPARTTFQEFRQKYETELISLMSGLVQAEVKNAFNHFERLAKPGRVANIKTDTIDGYIGKRLKERGKKKGSTLSPATVNKEMRFLRAALNVAIDWGLLAKLPKFRMVKEPGKLVRYVPPDHFAAIYGACSAARLPRKLSFEAAEWWRALIVTGYMTGWRIGAMVAIKREDVDLVEGTVISWAEDNKGKRDQKVKVHPIVLEHWKRLAGFTPKLFPWKYDRATLWQEFRRIQEAAGIKLPCREKHEHTPACYVYGFHDLRRAFATMNASRLTADSLQHLMQHRSYATTKKYIEMTRQQDEAVASLHVPDVLSRKNSGSTG